VLKIINPQRKSSYQLPTKVYFGRGAIDLFPEIIQERKFKKLLLVAGEHFKKSNKFNEIVRKIKDVKIYENVVKRCDFININKLIKFCREDSFDAIAAIGGGTVLDAVKCASAVSVDGCLVEDYLISKKKEVSRKGLSFLAIPTTAGTGSEVTPWATVWDKGKKYSLDSKYIFPEVAIVDPALTDSLSKNLTSEPGIDALCQAIEAYWNIHNNAISDKYALESIKIILMNLEQAVNNPEPKVRDAMAWGSLLAGLAFSNTRTTICHAVSYPMTAHWSIPHGQATSITLPLFIKYVFPVLSKGKLSKILSAMKVKNIIEASQIINDLMIGIGLKTKFSDLGITKKDVDLIVEEGFDPSRSKNTPKVPSPLELEEMLYSIL